MERTSFKKVVGRFVLLTMFLLTGLLYTNQVQAQSGAFSPAEPQQLSDKSTETYDFVSDDDAFQILSVELKQLVSASGNLTGGTAEATNSATIAYYTAIMEQMASGDGVGQAVVEGYSTLLATVAHFNVSVSTSNIVDGALNLLSL